MSKLLNCVLNKYFTLFATDNACSAGLAGWSKQVEF